MTSLPVLALLLLLIIVAVLIFADKLSAKFDRFALVTFHIAGAILFIILILRSGGIQIG